MIIGLTGASGSGKSTVAGIFAGAGYLISDCDAISRSLDTDTHYVSRIEEAFGSCVISFSLGKKRVDRKALAGKIFGDGAVRGGVELLESISHPIIIDKVKKDVEYAKNTSRSIVIDAPLLFESGLDRLCDITVGVIAPLDVKIKRLCERDGIDESMAHRRFKKQKDDGFLKENCTYIIMNDGEREKLFSSAADIIKRIS